mmetsp:Transcript_4848/g.8773  ORF Transcript_4848/g.8773 Transcript_4848/m.8773 type:complete len:84 (-) Transcript_4848:181-432(-)
MITNNRCFSSRRCSVPKRHWFDQGGNTCVGLESTTTEYIYDPIRSSNAYNRSILSADQKERQNCANPQTCYHSFWNIELNVDG